jgi:hypothetical protein
MSNFGAEGTSRPNGIREPGARDPGMQAGTYSEGPRMYGVDQAASRGVSGDPGKGINLRKIVSFAKEAQGTVMKVPYIVPIAAGTAGFVLGVFASSRILRQLALMAGTYALKEAVKTAPKDEILNFAKRTLLEAIERQRA